MDHLSDVLTAISHPTRRAIIGRLANGPARFLEVAKPFDTALNAVTKHLRLLERAGLIERRKQGREVWISFRPEPVRAVVGWTNQYERFWNERLDEFERYFAQRKQNEEGAMKTASPATVDVKVERKVAASAGEAFDAWLDPAVPGSPWHRHEKIIANPEVDGLWYWRSIGGTPHYGRFTEISRPGRIRYTWMSPNTHGGESMVTVSFQEDEKGTLVSVRHSGLPNEEMARAHEQGWGAILGRFSDLQTAAG